METTNVKLPTGKYATAKTVAGSGNIGTTSESYNSTLRTVAVNVTKGEVRLRYAPTNARSAHKSTR